MSCLMEFLYLCAEKNRFMKKYLYICLTILLAGMWMTSCNDDETYAEKKEKERKAINSFLERDVCILGEEGDTVCKVGKINVISEQQFYEQDSVTNLERNEYVLFGSIGIYMQIVRKGPGEKLASGQAKRIICRFFEFNILGDSLQLRSDVNYWHTNPDILDVENTLGTITASFNKDYNGGGAMYMVYKSTSVPTGWITPLSYINLGRQKNPDERIAKVRLILPHSVGQTDATTNVYPCFYELTYQEMRD